jgi:hypothetical protein
MMLIMIDCPISHPLSVQYVKLPDKPKIQYELLPQVTTKVQYEILPPTALQLQQKVVYDEAMPFVAGQLPPPVRGAPPAKPMKPTPGGLPPPLAPLSPGVPKKSKQCQRCDVNKATQKATIADSIPLKLCGACTDVVQSDPLEAVAAVEKATGVKLELKKSEPQVTLCERCKKRPAHGRFTFDGKPTLCCQTCFTEHPDHIQMTRYAAACCYHKDYDEARSAFLELIKMTPNHGNTLYNLACVEGLSGNADEGYALFVRALENGYTNWSMVRSDPDLAAVRAHAEFNAVVAKWEAEDKANRGPGAGQRLMSALSKAKASVAKVAKSRADGTDPGVSGLQDSASASSVLSSVSGDQISQQQQQQFADSSNNFGGGMPPPGPSGMYSPLANSSNNFGGPSPLAQSGNFGNSNFGGPSPLSQSSSNFNSPPTVRPRAPTAPNVPPAGLPPPPGASPPWGQQQSPGSPPVLSPRTSASRLQPSRSVMSVNGGGGSGQTFGGPPPTLARSFSGDFPGGPPPLAPRGSMPALAPRPSGGGPPPGRSIVSAGGQQLSIMPVMSSPNGPPGGALPPPNSDGRRVPSQAEYSTQSYWHGDFNRTVAENHLAQQHVGAFVLRPSSQFGCLSLSHRKTDGTIGHALVHMHTGMTARLGWSIEDEMDDYPSLHDLLLSLDKLKYP